MTCVLETEIPGVPKHQGKVRDVYDFGERLLIVATDRISAFDWILPTGVPEKGKILTQLSLFWFDLLGVPHHLLSSDPRDLPLPDGTDVQPLLGRSMVVKKTQVIPIECVVRGYLAGSGWVDYQKNLPVSGVKLPEGLVESNRLPEPIFTPSTKAVEGHDMPIAYEAVRDQIGAGVAEAIRDLSHEIYSKAADYALGKGLILADTKFEFGFEGGQPAPESIILIDEVLTPDSSRYWPADDYEPGRTQVSFDKQYVRNWLLQTDWDRNSPPPELPDDVVANTRSKYVEAYERLTGRKFD
ncbi:phosphoribosylaminoimidazolesuccinocarboxamide synthase [Rubinisphaera margarita]|uniref:phosphoribosylaminoimidazolesuccinocarboxamide synthase n=1 Tax=Rubinisphaera margarita TaxID=2909586 RepID=UPI001EE78846|nr:phosphoribosylaminoimidazolesuccinocarboxamide synthase [Rubinisphaera margarita]MCG6157540.1 phosphoribosylaminoimidazolesuccinocarboxamide synthase [Rubinisphaera margarita]